MTQQIIMEWKLTADLHEVDNFLHDWYQETSDKFRERTPEDIIEMILIGYCNRVLHNTSRETIHYVIKKCKNSGIWDGRLSLWEEYTELIKERREIAVHGRL